MFITYVFRAFLLMGVFLILKDQNLHVKLMNVLIGYAIMQLTTTGMGLLVSSVNNFYIQNISILLLYVKQIASLQSCSLLLFHVQLITTVVFDYM